MSKNLRKNIKKANLMDIAIKYGTDKIQFNLAEELKISENKINTELKEQPTYYGFLCVLMNKLERVKADKKVSLQKIKAQKFIDIKADTDPNTSRPYSNDLADAIVLVDKDYNKALQAYNKSEEDFNIIKSCVDAFNQRSHLIQSLSANVRKEKDNS